MPLSRLAPELIVSDLHKSLQFWCDLLGFEIQYQRADEGFAFLSLDGVFFMLEQERSASRLWKTADFARPLGRGVNFEITLASIEPVLQRLTTAAWPLFMEPETKTYAVGDRRRVVRQFIVQDPDGYLLRFAEVLAES